MPKAIMKCRVCGKDYEACRSAKSAAGVFRWQEVACSPECGAEYLRRVQESRGLLPKKEEPAQVVTETSAKRSTRKKSAAKKQAAEPTLVEVVEPIQEEMKVDVEEVIADGE